MVQEMDGNQKVYSLHIMSSLRKYSLEQTQKSLSHSVFWSRHTSPGKQGAFRVPLGSAAHTNINLFPD